MDRFDVEIDGIGYEFQKLFADGRVEAFYHVSGTNGSFFKLVRDAALNWIIEDRTLASEKRDLEVAFRRAIAQKGNP